MRLRFAAALLVLFVSASAGAQTVLQPGLAGLGFLLGHWIGEDGKVAETGGTSRGVSDMTVEAGGAVLLRRDHVALRDAAGKQAGGFDILMTVYAEDGAIHADYADGTHLIHYVSAAVAPGQSVAFSSAAAPGRPVFRLSYERNGPGRLRVVFGMRAPGQADFQQIATGVLRKGV